MPLVGILLIGVGVYVYRVGDYIESNTAGGPFISCYMVAALLFAVGLMCMAGG